MSDWSLSDETHQWILAHVPRKSIILELGSGEGSARLAEFYEVWSVEHDKTYLNLHSKVNYLYAPLQKHKPGKFFDHDYWYSKDVIARTKALNYAVVIIDGPPGKHSYGESGRSGFLKYLHLFKSDAILIFDDLHRNNERKLANKVAARLGCPLVVYGLNTSKHFGVIWPGKEIKFE